MVSGSENSGEQIDSVIADFLEASETGQSVDEAEWLDRYPQHASELMDFFDNRRQVERLSTPLRAVAQSPMPDDLRHPLGDFQIVREVGRGGMGIVYEAKQLSLGRRMALKVLPLAAVFDRRQLQRFKNEARAAAQLRHPNIVGVHSVGCERSVHFYAMDFIEGRSLAQLIEQLRESDIINGPRPSSARADQAGRGPTGEDTADTYRGITSATTMPVDPPRPTQTALSSNGSTRSREFFRSVADLGFQAADALEYAHQHGIIHRDVKPANLLVDADQHLWITDFGLARIQTDAGMTVTGDVVGTLRYMSPEQALGRRTIDHHTDIYSLGVTLYELLALRPAFPGSDRQALIHQIAEDQPPPLRRLSRAIPADLETIVLKATHKSPEDRYATAQEMADDLQRFQTGQAIRARRLTPIERLTRWTGRHKALVTAIVAVLTLTTLGLAVATALINQQRTRAISASADLEAALGRERKLRKDAQHAQQQAEGQAQRALGYAAFARSHVAELQAQAAAYNIYALDGDDKTRLYFVPNSVLDWDYSPTQRSRSASVGAVFIWLRGHRPDVIGTVFRHVNPYERITPHELHSLSLGPLAAVYRGISVWSPAQAGVRLQPIPSAPLPANTAQDRLEQMRVLASRFTASAKYDGPQEALTMRREPFYRYSKSDADPLDGALFAFLRVADPDLVLMIEARGNPLSRRWYFALARLSPRPLWVNYRQKPVWSAPFIEPLAEERTILEAPEYQKKRSYLTFQPALIPEIRIGDRHRELVETYDRLGLELLRAGRHAEATAATDEALRIWQETGQDGFRYPVSSLDSDSIYMDLIKGFRNNGRYQEAEDLAMQAIRDFERLAIDFPENDDALRQLAWLHAELGHWNQVVHYLTAVAQLDPDPESKASWLSCVAFAHLASGQSQAYSRICADVLSRIGDSEDHEATIWTIESCLYAPRAVSGFDRLVSLASEACRHMDESNEPLVAHYVHAAALYRAGHIDEAADRLRGLVVELAKRHTHLSRGCGFLARLFLAMAYAELGKPAAARTELDAATKWMESRPWGGSVGDGKRIDQLEWYTRVRLRALRCETEALLDEGDGDHDLLLPKAAGEKME